MGVVHLDGSRRVEVADATVFDEYTRHTVGRSRHNATVIEAQVVGRLVERAVPVLCSATAAQPEMPLPDSGRGVARLAEQVGQGELFGADDKGSVTLRHARAGSAERIFACEQTVARGCACGGRGIGVGEACSACRELVYVGRFHTLGAVSAQVAIAEVVGQEDDDVGLLGTRREMAHQSKQ